MPLKYTIYGERCSGTNYLENLINLNFNSEITWEFGWKHFFGFNDLNNSDDTLFIAIVRDPYNWINSLYREQHHLPTNFKNIDNFLNDEFYSLDENKNYEEIMADRNIYTNERYKNIFEMRHTKLKFLIDDMPTKVKNYILIRYEDLLNEFNKTMNKIKDKGLIVKNNIKKFPLNVLTYKKEKKTIFKLKNKNKINHINIKTIEDKLNMIYESKIKLLN